MYASPLPFEVFAATLSLVISCGSLQPPLVLSKCPLSLFLTWCVSPAKVFPDSSFGKESANNVGDLGSIPGLGRSPGEGTG